MLQHAGDTTKQRSSSDRSFLGVLAGLSTAIPQGVIAQTAAVSVAQTFCKPTAEQLRSLNILYRRTCIERRGSVLLDSTDPEEPSQSFFPPAADFNDRGPTTAARMERYAAEVGRLGLRASADALRQCRIPPKDITHVVTASCTGFCAPGLDILLIKQLGLSPTVERTHVGFMGCHGALNALRVAGNFTRSDPTASVLVCAAELCSLHFAYGWDPERVVANAIFADGAGAAVITPSREPSEKEWRLAKTGSCMFPESESAMSWSIGDHGFEMTLSPKVPELISSLLRPWMSSWLASEGLAIDDIGSWAIHPGGPRIVSAAADALELSPRQVSDSLDVLAEHGNMSSATILFVLRRLIARRAELPCVALAFGPGLVAEALLLV